MSLIISNLKNEIDIFSQETFGKIKEENIKNNLDFYIVNCPSNNKDYFFEASGFIENYLRNQLNNKHPFTREKISSFKVLKNEKDNQYIKVFDETNAIYPVNYLALLLNNSRKSDKEKGKFYYHLGECYRTGENCTVHLDRAIHYLTKAAELCIEDARYNLSLLLGLHDKHKSSLQWAYKPWENKPIEKVPVKALLEIANCFERSNHAKEAFLFFHEAACKGNPYGIAKIKRYYSEGFLRENSPNLKEFWKNFSSTSLEDLIKKNDPSLFEITKEINLPDYVKNSYRLEKFPSLEKIE